MKKLSIREVKKIASEEDAVIYAYIETNAKNLAREIIGIVKETPQNEGGSVFVYGPQNSGKSIVVCELSRLAREMKISRKHIVAQPHVDRVDVLDNQIYSRNGVTCNATSFRTKADIEGIFHDHSFVIVDEIQFTPYELQSYYLREATQFVERGGWLVNIGLLYTSVQTEFLLSSVLYDRSSKKYELVSTCQMCGRRKAVRNQRLVNGRSVSSDSPELLPPSDKVTYEPRCIDCLNV